MIQMSLFIKQEHWEDPEGRDGEGSGRGDQDEEHM